MCQRFKTRYNRIGIPMTNEAKEYKTKIREYSEREEVTIIKDKSGLRLAAWNQGGQAGVNIDLIDILQFVKDNMPWEYENLNTTPK